MTNQPKSPAQTYNDFFGPVMFTPWAKNLIEQSTPSNGDRVLDLACGTGLVTEQIAPHVGNDGSIVGLDFNPGMLAVARNRTVPGPTVDWVEASAQDIPFGENEFDRVYCQQGFQFFPDPDGAAAEVKRVLKPGGSLAISLWTSLEDHPLWAVVFKAVGHELDAPIEATARPVMFGSDDDIQNMLEGAGFSNIEINRRTDQTNFGSPDSFIRMMVQGAAAAIPAFGELTDQERADMAGRIESDSAAELQKYVNSEGVLAPTTSYTALATA